MMERISKSMSRNIYYGGSAFAVLVLLGLTFDTMQVLPKRENRTALTENVVKGKGLWETNNCVGCHSLMGEGAYFAPELGNVFDRRGGSDEAAFKAYFSAWMAAQPLAEEGRRKMPQFNLNDAEVDALADFLIWTSRIDDNEWPPNIEG